MNSHSESGTVDAAMQLAADWRRRAVVEYLRDGGDGEATLEELVDHVATASPDGMDAAGRERLSALLHHVHLPILAEANVVVYDSGRCEVQYDPAALGARLERMLDTLAD